MIEFSTLSTTKRVAIIFGVLLSAFLIGGSVGYVRGAFGDDGSTERAMEWAVKTGLWGILLIIVSTVFGRIETFIESNWKLPFIACFAIMMGFVFAIMDGSGVLLKIESGKFWFTVLSGFTQGVIGGILGGILIQKF